MYDFLIFTVGLSVPALGFADLLRPSQLLILSGESFCLLNFVPLEGICLFTFGYLFLCECRGDPGSSCTCGEQRRLLSAPGSNWGVLSLVAALLSAWVFFLVPVLGPGLTYGVVLADLKRSV